MRTVVAWLASFIIMNLAVAQSVHTYIPERAYRHLPTVYEEALRFTPEIPVGYYGGLIEHEACLSLTHGRCWSPSSEFKTSREQGVGLGMITRAWDKKGGLRFDSLQEMRNRYRTHLRDLSWNTIKQRPDLQIRAIVLMSMENWNALYSIEDPFERLAMSDAAYNGGLGGVRNDRRLCGLKKGCDPQKWFGHVELTSNKSRSNLYGQRSAFDINRHHVSDVLKTRKPKYDRHFKEKYDYQAPF